MTIDRAIEILDPEHRENYDGVDEWTFMGLPITVTHWMPLPEPPKEEQKQ